MQAVMLRETGGPDKIRVEQVDTPQPAANEVRVKLKTSALNRRDYRMTTGMYPRIELPCIPGSDGAGVVDAVGREADAGLVGKEVVLDTLKPAGRYVFFGATLGPPSKGLQMAKLFFKQVRIQGTTMGSPTEFSAMMDFVAEKKIEPVVDRVLPLEKAKEAFELMESFSQTGKIVLKND